MSVDENVDPWRWSKSSFRDFLSGKLIRNYRANYAYYKLAFSIVHQMIAEKTDIPRLLNVIRKSGNAEEAVLKVTGKRIEDFVPPEVMGQIADHVLQERQKKALTSR